MFALAEMSTLTIDRSSILALFTAPSAISGLDTSPIPISALVIDPLTILLDETLLLAMLPEVIVILST